tara:strand:+ start:2382 stop:2783 length:402 start_codon:yes stop_codon:yes gene_type:complete
MKILATVAALMLATTATAQSTNSNAHTSSGASSNLNQTFEGSSGAPSAGANVGNNTATCMRSDGVGIGVSGLGLSFSNSWVEDRCMTQVEAKYLVNLLNMPNGPARQAAVYHSCAYSPALRHTLVALGHCVMR